MKATVLAESSCYFFNFYRMLSAPAMSSDADFIQQKRTYLVYRKYCYTESYRRPQTDKAQVLKHR